MGRRVLILLCALVPALAGAGDLVTPLPNQLQDPVGPYQPAPPSSTVTVTPIPNTVNEMGVDVWMVADGQQTPAYAPPQPPAAMGPATVVVPEPAQVFHPGPVNPLASAAPVAVAYSAPAVSEPAPQASAGQIAAADYNSFMGQQVAVFLKDATVDQILSYLVPSPWRIESDLSDEMKPRRFHVAFESTRAAAFNDVQQQLHVKLTAYPKLGLIVATDKGGAR